MDETKIKKVVALHDYYRGDGCCCCCAHDKETSQTKCTKSLTSIGMFQCAEQVTINILISIFNVITIQSGYNMFSSTNNENILDYNGRTTDGVCLKKNSTACAYKCLTGRKKFN